MVVIAALHLEEIAKDPQRISKLQHYEDHHHWNGLGFPLAIQRIGNFEKNSPGNAVSVLFNSKNGIRNLQIIK